MLAKNMLDVTSSTAFTLRHAPVVFCLTSFIFLQATAVAPILRAMKPFWNSADNQGTQSLSRDLRWADAAFRFLKNVDCDHAGFTGYKVCFQDQGQVFIHVLSI